jgi:hypothetical protein
MHTLQDSDHAAHGPPGQRARGHLLLCGVQAQEHPKLQKQLDYLAKLVKATVHAMGSTLPGGR